MPTLVIVGGLGMGEQSYREVREVFTAAGWRVAVPALWVDRQLPADDWIRARSDLLAAYLHDRKIRDYVLLAESSGGLPALAFAGRYPDLAPVRLYLTNAVSLPGGAASWPYLTGLVRNWIEVAAATNGLSYGLRCLGEILFNALRHYGHVRQDAAVNQSVDQLSYTDNVRVSTVVLWGKDEDMLPTDYARRLAARLPDGKLRFVDGGHIWIHGAPRLLLSILEAEDDD